ncbi:ATP-binding protein [uncultured Chloroflexus sp.]|uniref:sensor histidine kinase n=1 Tax=uncultured Chloroflexus sp. TaxID=214040 RepID=UPI0026135085|nr:ATP-binding protein [uncultured Chloroflexus sp.]
MKGGVARGGLRRRLFIAHLLTIAAGAITLLGVMLLLAPGLHDRLMVAWLGPHWAATADDSMIEMERATNAIFTQAMVQALTISSGAAMVVAVVVSFAASRRVAQPLERLVIAARRIAAGHYRERVPIQGDYELAQLAAQFNTMAATLENAEQRRVALIGDVAHELRTPLATIAGYVEGMLDGVVESDEGTWVLVLDEVNRLRRLVGDLQELSRVESGQVALNLTAVTPAALSAAAVARLEAQFAEKGVTLRTQVAADLPLVSADPDRVLQVLINLLGNALHYTPVGGEVTVQAVRVGDAVQWCVRDTGIGIAAEHLPHLFERFYRVDKARMRATGGAGIGLTICKALVELHGGQIWGESAGLGQGAAFFFTVPLFHHYK